MQAWISAPSHKLAWDSTWTETLWVRTTAAYCGHLQSRNRYHNIQRLTHFHIIQCSAAARHLPAACSGQNSYRYCQPARQSMTKRLLLPGAMKTLCTLRDLRYEPAACCVCNQQLVLYSSNVSHSSCMKIILLLLCEI